MNEKIRHTPGPWYSLGRTVHPERSGVEMLRTLLTAKAHAGYPREAEGNAALAALAPTAPHSCDAPDCPGRENKRRLEEHEECLANMDHAQELGSPFSAKEVVRRLEAYPALLAENERLTMERDAAYGLLGWEGTAPLCGDCAEVKAANATLVEALRRYGVHQPGCWFAAPARRRPVGEQCSCGLDEALRKGGEE